VNPQFLSRRIGDVNIFQVRGTFSEPWVKPLKREMNQAYNENPAAGLLFNVREVEKVDELGAETVLEFTRRSPKSGILGHNLSAYFIAEHMNPNEPIPIFEKEREAVGYFEKELIRLKGNFSKERRKFHRTKTAVPVELKLSNPDESLTFEAVLTDLSVGGFFAYFLDASTEEAARRSLNPFDLKILKARLWFQKGKLVEVEGKILRTEKDFTDAPGVAVEFYNLKSTDEKIIQDFLREEEEVK